MKRLTGIVMGSGMLIAAFSSLGMQQFVTANSEVVSDQEAALLFGGACEDGHKYTYDTSIKCATGHNNPYVGCSIEYGYKDEGEGGSWKRDDDKNCGVSECGTVTDIKTCSSL